MPKMVCPTDRVIATNQGYTFRFPANEPIHIPRDLVSFVMERGATPVTETDVAEVTLATEQKLTDLQRAPTDYVDRQLAIVACIADLIKRDDMVFTASGKPSPAVLSKKLRFTIDAAERDEAWAAYQAGSEGA